MVELYRERQGWPTERLNVLEASVVILRLAGSDEAGRQEHSMRFFRLGYHQIDVAKGSEFRNRIMRRPLKTTIVPVSAPRTVRRSASAAR
jgi:hypothetical protein